MEDTGKERTLFAGGSSLGDTDLSVLIFGVLTFGVPSCPPFGNQLDPFKSVSAQRF